MSRGGPRPGVGRKPTSFYEKMQGRYQILIPKWMKALEEGKEQRDPVCMKLFADYCFGEPITDPG